VKLLLIEDDPHTADFISKGLREAGHTIDHLRDGREGLFRANSEPYDVMIVDRMLPSMDGLTIVRTLRAAGVRTEVLVLSALSEVEERVAGLRAGGDDYLSKPFSMSELLARVESLYRRKLDNAAISQTDHVLRLADLELDLRKRTVKRAGKKIEIQPKEFQLLEFLMRHSGDVVTRTMLLEHVWGYHFDPKTNVIDVHISNLRNKIDKGREPALLHTLRGAGYKLSATAD
jgi:two-component system, OmpR family, response regulator